jgi:predicted amidophosphoribosyltransferase
VATVGELTALYENFMLAPVPGPGVCSTCLTFTDGYSHCYTCATTQPWLDAVAPISYSVAHEQLHHALASYKRLTGEVARRLQTELAAILWRFLDGHEACVARRAGTRAFDLVTTVPSRVDDRDGRDPLASIVADTCFPTRERHRRLLARAGPLTAHHEFDAYKFQPLERLDGQSVLLIDDTWTTGANAQSAAAALKRAGAGSVAAVVIGRHLKRDWHENDRRLRELIRPFDWGTCACCATPAVAWAPQCRSQ